MTDQPDDINDLPIIPNDLRDLQSLLQQRQEVFAPILQQASTPEQPDAPQVFGSQLPPALALTQGDYNSMSLGSGSLSAMFFGQSNVLPDPTFEQVASQVYSTNWPTGPTTCGLWKHQRVLNSGSGSAASSNFIARTRLDQYDPFNSAILELTLVGTGTSITADNTYYIWPATDFDASKSFPLPYLVASVKAGDLGQVASVYTSVSKVLCQLELLQGTTVVATSDVLDVKTLTWPDARQLVVAYQTDAATFLANTWRFRIRIDIATTGLLSVGQSFGVSLGEPVMRYAYAPEAGGPHTPPIGDWYPTSVRQNYGIGVSIAETDLIKSVATSSFGVFTAFSMNREGTMNWGSTVAAPNVNLYWGGDNILRTDDFFWAQGLHLVGTNDLSLTSTDHAFQVGDSSGQNIAIDPNEIMARANGATSTLFVQAEGGPLNFGGGLDFGNRFSSTIDADTNDYNPTGLPDLSVIRFTSLTAPRNLTGIVATREGHLLLLVNGSASDLTLVHGSASSALANRFRCPGTTNLTLRGRGGVFIMYLGGLWQVLAP